MPSNIFHWCIAATILAAANSTGNSSSLILLTDNRPGWFCSFSQTTCGMKNQRHLRNFTLLSKEALCHERGIYYLDMTAQRNGPRYPGARIITPYFRVGRNDRRRRCFRIRYLLFGDAMQTMIVWQQDLANRIIWRLPKSTRLNSGYWHDLLIPIRFIPGLASRLFLEVQIKDGTGFLALSQLAINTNCPIVAKF